MLNTGTDQLDHLLNIGKIDRCGLGFKGKSSKGGCVFVSAGVTENVATYATKTVVKSSRGTVTDGKATTDDVKVATATATAAKASTVTVPKTGEVTAARTATATAARGATAAECTSTSLCSCLSSLWINHGRIRLMDTWSGRSGHYGDGGMSFYPQYGGWLMAVTPLNRFRHRSYSSASAMVLSTGHLQKDRHDKKRNNKSDSDTDSDHGENLKNFVAFTTLGSVKKSAAESVSSSVSSSVSGFTRGDDGVAGSEDDAEGFDLAKKYETLYAQWLTMVEENSVLAKEKVKLEAQIGEALKHASE
ncbi:hypothetical protein F2Q69_00027537 [Brassica cretica]|uniref:Uncharacterized protein n=1 Tax=Brassica cretica TaxID=69181 RepID=A0A8S9S7A1_BRACR|nr:hypothetical protein F2Q69_00027537 [Brassica cretica]